MEFSNRFSFDFQFEAFSIIIFSMYNRLIIVKKKKLMNEVIFK
jgi:hypothetical protein